MNNVAIAVAHRSRAVVLLDTDGILFDNATKAGYIHYKQFVEDPELLYEQCKYPTKPAERIVLSFSESENWFLVLTIRVCLPPVCTKSNGRAL